MTSSEDLKRALLSLDNAASADQLHLSYDGPVSKQPGWGLRDNNVGNIEVINPDDDEYSFSQDGGDGDNETRSSGARRRALTFNAAGRRRRTRPDLSSGYMVAQIRRAAEEDAEWEEPPTELKATVTGEAEDKKIEAFPGWATARIYLCSCPLEGDQTTAEREVLFNVTLPALRSRYSKLEHHSSFV